MKNAVKWSSLALAVAMGNGLIASNALAQESTPGEGIVEGATATLSSRTVYFNRDFRDADGNDDGIREEAATGMVLDFQSGFSEGLIGLGFDVTAMGGLKLDSSPDRTGTALLPVDPDGSAPNEYAEIRGAAKARFAEDTVLRYGTHFVENPVVAYEDARLLPNHYFGYSVTNETIEGLFVEAGRMTDRGAMNGSSQTDGAYGIEGEDVTYLGGSYTFNDALAATLYTSKADELWKRHFLGLAHTAELSEGLSLTSELAHYHTSDDSPGAETYDNDATSLALTLGAGNHGFTVAYQRMNGDNGYDYLDGAVFIANSVQYSDFNAKDERSWQARYDYDFAGLGIPGLTFMTRYITSSDIDTEYADIDRDSRWERDTNISYTVQNGTLEGVNLLWRNATVRQAAGGVNEWDGDIDENRLIVSYSWDLL